MWLVIERGFRKTKSQAIKIAFETLEFCTYNGKGGITGLKDFLSRFRVVMNTITEAGSKSDDFMVTDAFEREFKRIPELKEELVGWSARSQNQSAIPSHGNGKRQTMFAPTSKAR